LSMDFHVMPSRQTYHRFVRIVFKQIVMAQLNLSQPTSPTHPTDRKV
jgi:hypothetical protein